MTGKKAIRKNKIIDDDVAKISNSGLLIIDSIISELPNSNLIPWPIVIVTNNILKESEIFALNNFNNASGAKITDRNIGENRMHAVMEDENNALAKKSDFWLLKLEAKIGA